MIDYEQLKQFASDLLWSDPAPSQQEKWLDKSGFGEGERGPGAICFGDKAIQNFLDTNNLSHILRAHEPTQKGINISKGGRVITIFSTSRVCRLIKGSYEQDHGCRDAFCGCILVDTNVGYDSFIVNEQNIIAINHPDPGRMLESIVFCIDHNEQ